MLGEWKVIIVPQIYRVMVLVQPEQLFRFFKHKTPNKTLSTEFLTLAPQMPHTLRSMGLQAETVSNGAETCAKQTCWAAERSVIVYYSNDPNLWHRDCGWFYCVTNPNRRFFFWLFPWQENVTKLFCGKKS